MHVPACISRSCNVHRPVVVLRLRNRSHASFRLVPEIVGAIAQSTVPAQNCLRYTVSCYRLSVTAGGDRHVHRTTNQFQSPEPARRSSILLGPCTCCSI